MVALSREAVQMCIVPEGKLGAKVCGGRGPRLSAYRCETARNSRVQRCVRQRIEQIPATLQAGPTNNNSSFRRNPRIFLPRDDKPLPAIVGVPLPVSPED